MVIPDLGARVTLMDANNQVIAHLGDDSDRTLAGDAQRAARPVQAGQVCLPHGACFDHEGNIFVVEWVEVGRVTKLRKV